MRKFLTILHNIARFFLLFEKSITDGHHDAITEELKQNRIALNQLKKQCINNIKLKAQENVGDTSKS